MSISLAFSCGHALVIGACYRQKVAKHRSGRVYLSQITTVDEFIYHKLLVHLTLVCQLNLSLLGTPSSEHTVAIGKNNIYNYGGYHYEMLPL